jgi:hypothetical protein
LGRGNTVGRKEGLMLKKIQGGKRTTKKGEDYQAEVKKRKAQAKVLSKEERRNLRRNDLIIEHYESLKHWFPEIPPDDFFDTSRYDMSLTQEKTPEGVLRVVFKFTPKGGV